MEYRLGEYIGADSLEMEQEILDLLELEAIYADNELAENIEEYLVWC